MAVEQHQGGAIVGRRGGAGRGGRGGPGGGCRAHGCPV
ncbi:hypothetical protein Pd630_LPD05079 [Rhodococcus opacus PD630]|nr:hypothetical protein Pd630_LPD05079 [Rhodococcus opacus PD630]